MKKRVSRAIVLASLLIVVSLIAAVAFPGCNRPDAAGTSTGSEKNREFPGKIRVGHLVGICMSPLFLADAKGFFQEEGLDVELVFMPNPGDSVSALTAGSVQFVHNP